MASMAGFQGDDGLCQVPLLSWSGLVTLPQSLLIVQMAPSLHTQLCRPEFKNIVYSLGITVVCPLRKV